MVTGRVAWSRYGGEDIEHAVAMFIASEHPRAERITPSRGDGGIDILDKVDGRAVVYQVKGFHEPLEPNQKRQVERSIDRLLSDPRWGDLDIAEWHLVTPWDATPEAKQWLTDYATESGLPEPIWDGLTDCDRWAAKYPYIVDYYFHGNRERIAEAASGLLAGLRLKEMSETQPEDLTPAKVSEELGHTLRFLNEQHPFYCYGIEVAPATGAPQEDLRAMTTNPRPGLVESRIIADSSVVVRVDVYAKSALSLELCPITVNVTLTAQKDSPEERAIRDWMKFGAPLTLPFGSVSGTSKSPGGLGGEISQAALSVWPVEEMEKPYEKERRLVVFDADGEEIVRLLITRTYSSHGLPNEGTVLGVESKFTDKTGCLTLIFRFDYEKQTSSANLSLTIPEGVLATDAYETLRAFRALRSPENSFILAPRSGPIPKDRIRGGAGGGDEPDGLRFWHDLAKALSLLQEHTPLDLLFPHDLDAADPEQLTNILRTGALLEGQVMRVQAEYLGSEHEKEPPACEETVVRLTPWAVDVAEGRIDLGDLLIFFKGSVVESGKETERGLQDIWKITDSEVLLRAPRPGEVEPSAS